MNLDTKIKRLIIFSVLLIGIGLYVFFRFFVEQPPPAVAVPPSVQLLESRLIGRRDGSRQWEILAQSVLQTGDLITLTNLDEITMFQNEEPHLFIQAHTATWDRKRDVLHLYESLLKDGDGAFLLESELLVWDGRAETLTSPGPAFILWQGLEIEAAEMFMEATNDLLHLRRNVKIRDGSMVWRLENAIYDLERELMDFYGSLVLEEEALDDE